MRQIKVSDKRHLFCIIVNVNVDDNRRMMMKIFWSPGAADGGGATGCSTAASHAATAGTAPPAPARVPRQRAPPVAQGL